jgi:hypothetical protein
MCKPTPEEAALGTRPDATVIAAERSPDDAHAVVLVDKGRPGDPYVLQVVCERVDGGWRSFSDANGCGWTGLLDGDFAVGVVTLWGEVSPNQSSVMIRWQGKTVARHVAFGHYLFAAWDVPQAVSQASLPNTRAAQR